MGQDAVTDELTVSPGDAFLFCSGDERGIVVSFILSVEGSMVTVREVSHSPDRIRVWDIVTWLDASNVDIVHCRADGTSLTYRPVDGSDDDDAF